MNAETTQIKFGGHDERTEGFSHADEYRRHLLEINSILAAEKAQYLADPAAFYENDIENPALKHKRILVECADGRNTPALFMEKGELMQRYSIEWLPIAGLILAPEVPSGLSSAELSDFFLENSQTQILIFDRLDFLFLPKVTTFLESKKALPILHKLSIEFQSHFDGKKFPENGCGAHLSNFDFAQLEAIKDCQLTELWLQLRFPDEFSQGFFRIYRTTHDTGDNGHIYTGSYADKMISEHFQNSYQQLISETERFQVPDNNDNGIFKPYKGNHHGIEIEDHAEQIIRISQTHFAHTLMGQSVLEICWTDNVENLFDHLKVLLGIIEQNYRKNYPDKPAIIRLDIPFGDEKIEAIYQKLLEKITKDPELKHRLEIGTLDIVSTKTDRLTYKTELIS